MELQQLKYFLEVAQSQHITQSAQKLHIAQPALSQSIHRLEKELGVKLFASKGRNIVLTPCGKFLQGKLEGVMATLDAIPEQLAIMSKENYQTLHINVLAASTIMTDIIIEYGSIHDGVKFQLLQNTENDDGICDIEITTKMNYAPNDTATCFECPERIFLAVPNNKKYSALSSINLQSVEQEDFISLMGSKQFRYICDRFCHQAGIVPKIIFESDSPAAVKNMIGANLGIGFWPEYTWGEVENESVKLLEIENPSCQRSIVVTCNSSENENAVNFFNFVHDKLFDRIKNNSYTKI